jgi:predicted P-loop ATPase
MSSTTVNDELTLHFAVSYEGARRDHVKNVTWTWRTLCQWLSDFKRDTLTLEEFKKLPKERQLARKNVGYFIGGTFKNGIRGNLFAEQRQVITLDIDVGNEKLLEALREGTTGLGPCEYFVHSTRTHGDGAIKLHIVIPLSRRVDGDEFNALSRLAAWEIDPRMMAVDPVSFVPAQLMFWPSTCADIEPIIIHRQGPLLDIDRELAEWGDWRDIEMLPRSEREKKARPRVAITEEPTSKRGPVGVFCRRWNIPEAIAEFLSDIYVETSESGRWTYTKGTSTNGAIVYDDGHGPNKMESHHTSDPAFGQNNSFDLTCIHLYGHLDGAGDHDKPPQEKPSYKAFTKWLSETQPAYLHDLRDSYYGEADGDEPYYEPGADAEAQTGPTGREPVVRPSVPPKRVAASTTPAPAAAIDDPDWRDRLDINEKGTVKAGLANLILILRNDRWFKGKIAYNEMINFVTLRQPIKVRSLRIDTSDPFDTPDITLTDVHRSQIRHILEAPRGEKRTGWGLKVAARDLDDAIGVVAGEHRYHPVREYLEALGEWDGEGRIEKLFTTACHTDNSIFARDAGRKIMLAAVDRAMRPGGKFDYLPVLEGPQGIGKSRFCRMLAPDAAWFGESEGHFDDAKKFVESTLGFWFIEIPELTQFTRADVKAIKTTLSRQSEFVRLSYRENPELFKRSFVMFGTTNEDQYLRDGTGNRRIWPIRCGDGPIDLAWVRDNRDQLFAEALAEWREMVRQSNSGELWLSLSPDAEAEAKELQDGRMIETIDNSVAGQIAHWCELMVVDENGFGDPVRRDTMCGREAHDAVFPNTRWDNRAHQMISAAMRQVPGWAQDEKLSRYPGYGPQRVWRRIKKGED